MNPTSSNDDLTKLIDSLREDAAKNIEQIISEKLKELLVFKEEAIQNAEKIVADKIRQFEEDTDSFKNQSQYRWDETGLWVSAPPQPPIPAPVQCNRSFRSRCRFLYRSVFPVTKF